MRILLIIAISVFSVMANADEQGGPVRVGNYLISVGDSAGRLLKIAGKPDDKQPVENKFGAKLGETWIYYDTGINPKTLTYTVSDGKIYAISEHDGQ